MSSVRPQLAVPLRRRGWRQFLRKLIQLREADGLTRHPFLTYTLNTSVAQ